MKKILIYIVMIIFLIIPISYAKDKNCILKMDSVIANNAVDLVLYEFFIDINEKQLLNYMFDIRRLGTTTKNIEITILNIIMKEGFNIANVVIKNENIKVWVFNFDIECNGEENDKQKGKLLKDKKKKGKIIKNEQKGPLLKSKVLEGDPLWKKKKKLNENGEETGELNEG